MNIDQKQLAISKIKQDIDRKINRSIDIAKKCGFTEILLAVIEYHLRRIRTAENKSEMPNIKHVEAFVNLDSIKYTIQLIIKYGKQKLLENEDVNIQNIIDANKRFLELLFMANEISTTNEFKVDLELSPDVSFVTKRIVRSDLSNIPAEIQKYFDYAARVDFLNNVNREKILNQDDFFNLYLKEFEPYEQIIKDALSATPEEIVETYKQIFKEITDKIQQVIKGFEVDRNGLIHPELIENKIKLLACFLMDLRTILIKYKETTAFFLFEHIINKKEINVYNLQFYQLTRKPFIQYSDILIVSPEIVLESMFIDTHYKLLESSLTKDKYKQKSSELFLTKITNIANKAGFIEIERDKELYEGKRKIGDLDLVLRKDDFYLIIEAKNQSIPLDVYFHDLQSTKEQLIKLQNDWEKHVNERNDYLKKEHDKVGIGKNFKYIIVSKSPAVLSHFSNISCFAIEEFEKWIEYSDCNMDFYTFYNKFYNHEEFITSINELKEVQKRMHPNIWFADK